VSGSKIIQTLIQSTLKVNINMIGDVGEANKFTQMEMSTKVNLQMMSIMGLGEWIGSQKIHIMKVCGSMVGRRGTGR
jgi:hypothetical protein